MSFLTERLRESMFGFFATVLQEIDLLQTTAQAAWVCEDGTSCCSICARATSSLICLAISTYNICSEL